jgi:hypothetical protein
MRAWDAYTRGYLDALRAAINIYLNLTGPEHFDFYMDSLHCLAEDAKNLREGE